MSGDEARIADAVEAALCRLPRSLSVRRLGNVVVARTELGRRERVVLAGHLDTVPVAGNLPSRLADGRLHGCGTSDMKSGVALQLRVARAGRQRRAGPGVRPDLGLLRLRGGRGGAATGWTGSPPSTRSCWPPTSAILLEPTDGIVEGGCQGTMRAERATTRAAGRTAPGRGWAATPSTPPRRSCSGWPTTAAREVEVEGLTYREGLNAVVISGGVAGNVIPDRCAVTVNYRFAPDRSEAEAEQHLRDGVRRVRARPCWTRRRPPGRGWTGRWPRRAVAALGGEAAAKLGWTDVARFSALGIPALNFGPGDPNLAHTGRRVGGAGAAGALRTAAGGFPAAGVPTHAD